MQSIDIDISELLGPEITAPPLRTLRDYVPTFIMYVARAYLPKRLSPGPSPLEMWCVVQMLKLAAAYETIDSFRNPTGPVTVKTDKDFPPDGGQWN